MSETFSEKMTRVIGNMRAMGDMNAPEEDVSAYMQQEGVTPAHLRQWAAVEASAKPEAPNALERLGRGAQDVVSGVRQVTGNMTPEQQAAENENINQYQAAVGPGMDWMRSFGQAGMLAPLALVPGAASGAGLLTRAGVGAATGAASGGLLYARDGGERLTNVAGGAAGGAIVGAAAPSLLRFAGKVAGKIGDAARWAKGMINSGGIQAKVTQEIASAADEAGIPLADLGEAWTKRMALKARQLAQQGQPFDAAAEVRAAQAEKFGFTGEAGLTRGQATRDPAIFSQEENLMKRPGGGALATRKNAQLAQAEKYIDDLVKAPDLDPVEAADGLRLVAQSRAEALQEPVNAAYAKIPKGGTFSTDSLTNRTSEILIDFEDKVSAGVKRRIAEFADGKRQPTMDELIKLDKLVGDTMPPGADDAVNKAAGRLRASIVDVMGDAADSAADPAVKEAYTAAKAAAKKRFDLIGDHGGLVSQLVHGSVDPTQVPGKIMRGKLDDLRKLKEFLTPEDWAVIQRMTEKELETKARPGGQFSQAAYNNALGGVGKSRLVEIFGKDKADELFAFRDTARNLFRYPNFHNINTSNTASAGEVMLQDALGAVADAVPGGRLASGLLSRTKGARNAAQAEAEVAKIVQGLLNPQGPVVVRPNPAIPYLPEAGAMAVPGATSGAGLLRR